MIRKISNSLIQASTDMAPTQKQAKIQTQEPGIQQQTNLSSQLSREHQRLPYERTRQMDRKQYKEYEPDTLDC